MSAPLLASPPDVAHAPATAHALDLFAGSGWGVAARSLGLTEVGVEYDPAACATRAAAGFLTIRADVARLPADRMVGRFDGLIASPPCQLFSAAGKRTGRFLVDELARAIGDALEGRYHGTITGHRRRMARRVRADTLRRSKVTRATAAAQAVATVRNATLIVEVARFAEALRPRWLVAEQVPAVLPLWQIMAAGLDRLGYSTWSGELNAADYGVPQLRRRAILIARLDGPALPPEPTHGSAADAVKPSLFGPALEPWVTMAEALGWGGGQVVGFPRRDDLGSSPDGYRERDWHEVEGPAPAVTEKARSWSRRVTGRDWKPGGTRADAQTFDPDEGPAPTIDGKGRWHVELLPGSATHRRPWPVDEPGPTLVFGKDAAGWKWRGPHAEEATRVGLAEVSVLQSFPADHPWQGTRSQQFQQVGNAVPPGLAAAILRTFLRP